MAESIADRFIITMARINELDAVSADDPMRYAVWTLKQQAQQVLSDAARNAWCIADAAHRMRDDAAKAIAEAKEPS